jgi:hypothetical protein
MTRKPFTKKCSTAFFNGILFLNTLSKNLIKAGIAR